MCRLTVTLLGTLAAATAAAPISGRHDGSSQLAIYEGKRTTCWLEAITKLKHGCGGGSNVGGGGSGSDAPDGSEPPSMMPEEERRALAVTFANCQFNDDGLPTYDSATTMASLARDGDTLAYSVYTHHLLSVEIICMHLSQHLFHKANRQATAELLEASKTLGANVRRVAAETVEMQSNLNRYSAKILDDVRRSTEESELSRRQMMAQQARFSDTVGVMSETIRGAEDRIELLSSQSGDISKNLQKIETTSTLLNARQTEFEGVVYGLQGMVASLYSYSHMLATSLDSVLTFAGVLLCLYFFVSRSYLRGPLFALALCAFATEQFVITPICGMLGDAIFDAPALIGYSRRMYTGGALWTVIACWWRHRNPQQVVATRMTAIDEKLDDVRSALTRLEHFGALPPAASRLVGSVRRSISRSVGRVVAAASATAPLPPRAPAAPRQRRSPSIEVAAAAAVATEAAAASGGGGEAALPERRSSVRSAGDAVHLPLPPANFEDDVASPPPSRCGVRWGLGGLLPKVSWWGGQIVEANEEEEPPIRRSSEHEERLASVRSSVASVSVSSSASSSSSGSASVRSVASSSSGGTLDPRVRSFCRGGSLSSRSPSIVPTLSDDDSDDDDETECS